MSRWALEDAQAEVDEWQAAVEWGDRHGWESDEDEWDTLRNLVHALEGLGRLPAPSQRGGDDGAQRQQADPGPCFGRLFDPNVVKLDA